MNEDPFLNKQLDEYLLEKLLGQGGMAAVYRALDVRLKRYTAVKIILNSYQADADYKKRFEREAQAIAQLDHPHIVRIYRYGEAEGVLYMAMQFVEGRDLQSTLNKYEAEGEYMNLADVRRLLGEICEGLDYAHEQGVIHRDIKPANIMLDRRERVIVTDFGLALLTQAGTLGEVFGTPQYMAPEQAMSSASVVPQSDLYAVGIMLYRMLTGTVPFDGSDPLDIAMRHMTDEPRSPRELRPDISASLEAVVLKAIAKDPKARYETGAALVAAFDEAIQHSAVPILDPPSMTILERVNLDFDTLPPPPAGMPATTPIVSPVTTQVNEPTTTAVPVVPQITPAQPPTAVAPSAPATTPVMRLEITPQVLAAGAAGLVVLALLLVWLFSRGGTAETASATATTTAGTILTDTELSATATAIIVNSGGNNTITLPVVSSAEATSTVAVSVVSTPIPAPTTQTSAGVTYQLSIQKEGKSLFIRNATAVDLPLAALSFSFEDETFASWSNATLSAGACVLLVKDDHIDDKHTPDECQNNILETHGEIEWKDEFQVNYNGTLVASCNVKRDSCTAIFNTP